MRDSYAVLGPMATPGVNLQETRFPVEVRAATTSDGRPDLADVVYGIHRCAHSHGDDLPGGFELIPNVAEGAHMTSLLISKGRVALSDRVIFGLLGVAVLSVVNLDQSVPSGYHLTYGGGVLMIDEWWGRSGDFEALVYTNPPPLVTLDFGDWMDDL